MLEHTCIHMTMQAQASDLTKDFLSLNLQLKGNSAYLQAGFIAFPFGVGEVMFFIFCVFLQFGKTSRQKITGRKKQTEKKKQ